MKRRGEGEGERKREREVEKEGEGGREEEEGETRDEAEEEQEEGPRSDTNRKSTDPEAGAEVSSARTASMGRSAALFSV